MRFDIDGFPIISLDDFLSVAAKIRLVSLEHQPNRQEMIANLGVDSADKTAFESILANQAPTLKDFLLTRSAIAPSQTLPVIISYLSTSELYKIDLPNMLTNLMHYVIREELSVYDLSDIFYWYMAIDNFNKKFKKAHLDFMSCVDLNGNLIREISSLYSASGTVKLAPQTTLRISQQAIRIIFEDDYGVFQENIDPMSKIGLVCPLFNNKIAYILPISVQARIYQHQPWINNIPLFPLPVICSFDFEILEHFSCLSDDNYFRPVTFATYLDPKIKSLFFGARRVDNYGIDLSNGSNDDLAYDRYDITSAKPGLLDMYKIHRMASNPFGTTSHDCAHIWHCAIQTISLRKNVIKIINSILKDNINQAILNDLELKEFLYIKRVILSVGIYILFSSPLRANNNPDLQAALEKVINLILSRLNDEDRQTFLREAQYYGANLLPDTVKLIENILETKYMVDLQQPENNQLFDKLIPVIETIWSIGPCSKENIEEIMAIAAEKNMKFNNPLSIIQFIHNCLIQKKAQEYVRDNPQRLVY
jgi:hypothetical protein